MICDPRDISKFGFETTNNILNIHLHRSEEEDETPIAAVTSPSNLKPALVCNPPDLTPFFLKQYVKGHSADVLEELSILVSEMALRLPYQIKKVISQPDLFDTVRKIFGLKTLANAILYTVVK